MKGVLLMQLNIKLTGEQKQSVQREVLSEMTALDLTQELFGKIGVTEEDDDVVITLKNALGYYVHNRKNR
jgi:hypothetical protein